MCRIFEYHFLPLNYTNMANYGPIMTILTVKTI